VTAGGNAATSGVRPVPFHPQDPGATGSSRQTAASGAARRIAKERSWVASLAPITFLLRAAPFRLDGDGVLARPQLALIWRAPDQGVVHQQLAGGSLGWRAWRPAASFGR